MESKWIVACDGSRSTVRHQLDIPFKGISFEEPFLISDVVATTTLERKLAHIFLSNEGICGLIPLPGDNCFRIILPLKKGFITENNSSIDEIIIQKLMNDRLPKAKMEVETTLWTSLFYVRRAIVPSMRKKNVFLLGDAAHVHSPAGGQGLNTSVQDAFNLGWKIGLVIQKKAKPEILDTFDEERHPVAKEVLKETTKMTRILLNFHNYQTFYFKIFKWLFNKPYLLNRLINRLSELDINYRSSSLVSKNWKDFFWKGPKAGDRIPEVKYNGGRLYEDINSTKFILLLFEKSKKNENLIKKLDLQYSSLIKTICLDHHLDPENNVMKSLYAKSSTIYLLRPDGYIAFRSKRGSEDDLYKYLQKYFIKNVPIVTSILE